MTDTVVLTPLKGRVGKSRQVPAQKIEKVEGKFLEDQVCEAFHKYHRRGIEAGRLNGNLHEGSLVLPLYCRVSDELIAEIAIKKERDDA